MAAQRWTLWGTQPSAALIAPHVPPHADFRRKVLAPEQMAALQAQVEERMWVAADSAALRLLSSQPNSGGDGDTAGGEGGPSCAGKEGHKPHRAVSGLAHTGSAGDPSAVHPLLALETLA